MYRPPTMIMLGITQNQPRSRLHGNRRALTQRRARGTSHRLFRVPTGPLHPTPPFRLCPLAAERFVIGRPFIPHPDNHVPRVLLIRHLPQISYTIFRLYTHLNIYPTTRAAPNLPHCPHLHLPSILQKMYRCQISTLAPQTCMRGLLKVDMPLFFIYIVTYKPPDS